MEVTAFIIELSAEVVKGIQGGNECWTMNNGKLRGDGRRDGGEAIPPVVARIFSGDSTSPLAREGKFSARRGDSAENLINGADGEQSPPSRLGIVSEL